MSAWVRAGAVLLFVFAAGVLTGIIFEHKHSFHRSPPMSAEEEHEAAMAELREVLELDDHQVAQIHAILAERRQHVQLMWEQLRPEVQNAMRHVHKEIAELLRPDQRKRFHDWLIKRQAEHGSAPLIPQER